jgi:hypothetical protein
MPEYLRKYRKKTPRRWWRWLLGVVAILGLAGWAGEEWLGRKVEFVMVEELGKRGLTIQHGMKTWDPWRGLHLSNVVVRYRDGSPMAEFDNIGMTFPLGQVVGRGEKGTHWRISNASVKLHDEAGEVALEKVSLRLDAKPGEIAVESVELEKDGLRVAVKGSILIRSKGADEAPVPFHLPLRAVRGTLAALRVAKDPGPLKVTGDFSVDARQSETTWTATLHGASDKAEWVGVPLQNAKVEAVLTQGDSRFTGDLGLAHGYLAFTVTRQDWHDSPFVFSGAVKDGDDRSDSFNGSYLTGTKRFVIERLQGPADLWKISEDVPFLAPKLPDQVSFETFPEIDLKRLVREGGEDPPRWSVGAVSFEGSGKLKTKDGEIPISGLSGGGELKGETCTIENAKAKVFGGLLALSGRYESPVLSNAKVHAESLKVSELKRWINGEADASKGLLSVDYRGSIDLTDKDLDGEGTMHLENAPVFDAPLLEQTYELFDAILPGVQHSKTGEFQAAFTAKSHLIDVTSFEAKGGTLTVNAKGTINLKTKRVDGTARGKLTGVKGLVTSPLSRLLEMNVGGPFDDIRVKPLGPAKLASNAANGTVGAATSTLKETGKIAGTVIVEGAKLPFRLFGGKDQKEDDGDKR